MIERLIGTKFWNAYFKVYDRNKSLPYLRLLAQNAQLVIGDPNGRYLDLGCGTGNSTLALAAKLGPRGEIIGLDSSSAALARARNKTSDPRVRFMLGDMDRELIFDGARFDGILANNSLYLVRQPETVVAEILRVLKPGGRFVLTNPKEAASSGEIFKEHLAQKRAEYRAEYGPTIGKVALALHSAEAVSSYLMLLPFQMVLKHSFKLVSNFWPQEQWQAVFEEVRRTGQISFFVEPPISAYAGQNHTFIGYRLPD